MKNLKQMANVLVNDLSHFNDDLGEDLRKSAEKLIDKLGLGLNCELGITLVDLELMANYNAQFLGEEGPTDVISIPIEDPKQFEPVSKQIVNGDFENLKLTIDDPSLLLGDVIICPQYASQNQHFQLLKQELNYLLIHGVLHLIGLDHQTPDELARMEAAQRYLMGVVDKQK